MPPRRDAAPAASENIRYVVLGRVPGREDLLRDLLVVAQIRPEHGRRLLNHIVLDKEYDPNRCSVFDLVPFCPTSGLV